MRLANRTLPALLQDAPRELQGSGEAGLDFGSSSNELMVFEKFT